MVEEMDGKILVVKTEENVVEIGKALAETMEEDVMAAGMVV